MALCDRRGRSPIWSLSGEEPTWRDGVENDAIDPKRHFANVNYRSAKGLFDHLVGAGLQRQRHCQAKRLCGLEVND